MFLFRWSGNPVLPDGLVYEGVSEAPLQVSCLFLHGSCPNYTINNYYRLFHGWWVCTIFIHKLNKTNERAQQVSLFYTKSE